MIRHIQSSGIVRTVYSNIIEDIQGYSGYLEIFRDIGAYSVTLTGVQIGESDGYSVILTGVPLEGSGRGLPCPFLKIKKKYFDFGKKVPDCVHLWVKFSIQNVVGEKSLRCFPAGPFLIVFLAKFLLNCPSSTKLTLP